MDSLSTKGEDREIMRVNIKQSKMVGIPYGVPFKRDLMRKHREITWGHL